MNEEEILELARSLNAPGKFCAIVDFTRTANEHRFFLIKNESLEILYSCFTSHGSGSGPLQKPEKFSNVPNSLCSSKGLMKTGETYNGKHGYSCRLHGLEPGVNDNMLRRAIVLHPSDYVDPDYVRKHIYPGRSWGCITLEPKKSRDIIDLLKGGSYVYVKA